MIVAVPFCDQLATKTKLIRAIMDNRAHGISCCAAYICALEQKIFIVDIHG